MCDGLLNCVWIFKCVNSAVSICAGLCVILVPRVIQFKKSKPTIIYNFISNNLITLKSRFDCNTSRNSTTFKQTRRDWNPWHSHQTGTGERSNNTSKIFNVDWVAVDLPFYLTAISMSNSMLCLLKSIFKTVSS